MENADIKQLVIGLYLRVVLGMINSMASCTDHLMMKKTDLFCQSTPFLTYKIGYNFPKLDVHIQRTIESIKLTYEKNTSWFSAVPIYLLSRSY